MQLTDRSARARSRPHIVGQRIHWTMADNFAGAGRPLPSWGAEGLLAPLSIFGLFAAVPLGAALFGQTYVVDLITRVMIFAIAAVALDLIVGFAGRLSLGHAAFIGVGAYATGILASHGVSEALLCLPTAVLASMLFALLTGTVCLRTQGAYFIMITLAFGQMVFFVGSSLAPYGGDNGLTMADRSNLAGAAIIASDGAFYYLVLALLLGTLLACRSLVSSRFGRVLRAPSKIRCECRR